MIVLIVAFFVLMIIIAVRSGGPRNKYGRYYRARTCPHCTNKIPGEASVCEFCHRDVVPTWVMVRRDQ